MAATVSFSLAHSLLTPRHVPGHPQLEPHWNNGFIRRAFQDVVGGPFPVKTVKRTKKSRSRG